MSQLGNELARNGLAYQRKLTTRIRGVLVRWLPRPPLQRLRYLLLVPLAGVDVLLGRRRDLVPPRYLDFVGAGGFEAIGDEFLQYFIDIGGLRPQDRVLDVGCGVGRMARPLTKYLTTGSYEGFDIVSRGIHWCQNNISTRYPNFYFQVADIRNRKYNPKGRFPPSEYRFPFKDGEFDFIFLTSVFTHMLKREMEHYLAEVSRTLRPGGKCFTTYFLLNEESQKLLTSGLSSLNFRFSFDGCSSIDRKVPEDAVGFEEARIRELYNKLGLEVETVQYGAWSGRKDYLSYQDVLVARKV
jgi:SAM-dependent methyltransferase